jgi:hypothetical protein
MVVMTPVRLFKFNHRPFSLCNVHNTLEQMMDCMLAGLGFAFAYLDNIIVASHSQAEHIIHLCLLLECLQQF